MKFPGIMILCLMAMAVFSLGCTSTAPSPQTGPGPAPVETTPASLEPTMVQDASFWINHGFELLNLGKNEESLDAFDMALSMDANDTYAWTGRGHVLSALRRPSEAMEAFNKALALDPRNPDAWVGKGNIFQSSQRNEEALAAYDKALAFKPDSPQAWTGKGMVFFSQGKDTESIRAFQKAISIDPGIPHAWAGLGNMLFRMGRNEEALDAFNQALLLAPGNPVAQQGKSLVCTQLELTREVSSQLAEKCAQGTRATQTTRNVVEPGIDIAGFVYDCSRPSGMEVGIGNATVSWTGGTAFTDTLGYFHITVRGDPDPVLTVRAPGFHDYQEKPSRMVKGGLHLIPDSIYRGVYLVVWNPEKYNPQNWLRKWEQQTEFVIVRQGATEHQIQDLVNILKTDKYRNLTGGRYSSAAPPLIVDEKPEGTAREGKTIISFAPGIGFGGMGHSRDSMNGIINYSEIIYDINQEIIPTVVWHEMGHTVTTGGHINEWPSVVSEVEANGTIFEMDEKIFNCIYNSPPLRSN